MVPWAMKTPLKWSPIIEPGVKLWAPLDVPTNKQTRNNNKERAWSLEKLSWRRKLKPGQYLRSPIENRVSEKKKGGEFKIFPWGASTFKREKDRSEVHREEESETEKKMFFLFQSFCCLQQITNSLRQELCLIYLYITICLTKLCSVSSYILWLHWNWKFKHPTRSNYLHPVVGSGPRFPNLSCDIH